MTTERIQELKNISNRRGMFTESTQDAAALMAVRSSAWLADDGDTQWQCTVCGRIGTVGRCCGYDTRKPLNEAARQEAERNKAANDRGQARRENPKP